MLVISDKQIAALEEVSTEAFLKRTHLHLGDWFRHHCESLNQKEIHAVIRKGWEKSNSYDLTDEACVRCYLELMCLLGSDFDTDVMLPWAPNILNKKSKGDEEDQKQVERGDLLHKEGWDYSANVAHDYQNIAKQSISDRCRFPDGSVETLAPHKMPRFVQGLKSRLRELFPVKFSYVSESDFLTAVSTSVQSARTYGITTERDATLFVVVRFILGAGFDKDPLLPWASAALNDPAVREASSRTDNLYAESIAFLARWWPNPAGERTSGVAKITKRQ